MKRYFLALDLKDDPKLINEYEAYHKAIWPEIRESIKSSGIQHMSLFRTGNRLFMFIEVTEGFSFEKKAETDATNPRVQEWETLMWKYQQALPWAKPGEKWVLLEKIFELD